MREQRNTTKEGSAERRPLRAIAYLRVSTAGQAERGMGLEAQRAEVRKYARAEGLELVGVEQEAASGAAREGELFSLEHRPILSALVARAEDDEYDVLLVATSDRLSREKLERLYLRRLLARFNVSIVSAAGDINENGDAISELLDELIGSVHEFDRKRIIERMKAGKAQGRKVGRAVESVPPYGYGPAVAGRFEIVEKHAEVVRRIFAEARSGLGPGPIARRLNDDGVPGPRGGTWNRQTVTNMLRNPVYAGELHGVKRAQPAIVSRRLFNSVQR